MINLKTAIVKKQSYIERVDDRFENPFGFTPYDSGDVGNYNFSEKLLNTVNMMSEAEEDSKCTEIFDKDDKKRPKHANTTSKFKK